MMFFIPRNAQCENFLERAVLRDVLAIEIRAVHGVISDRFCICSDNTIVGQAHMPIYIRLILDNKNKIINDSNVLRVSCLTCAAF